MKQKLFTYLTMSLIVLSTACKKGGDEPKPMPTPGKDKPVEVGNGKFSGKVDDASFETLEVGCIADHTEDELFVLVAADKYDNGIMITGPTQTGTFTHETNEDAGGLYTDKDGKMWMSDMEGGSYTITITKFNKSTKKMSGTYSFTAPAFTGTEATGTKVISGSFEDVNYVTADSEEVSARRKSNIAR